MTISTPLRAGRISESQRAATHIIGKLAGTTAASVAAWAPQAQQGVFVPHSHNAQRNNTEEFTALIRVPIANRQRVLKIDRLLIRRAVRHVLQDHGITEALLSVAVVDDPTIARLHGMYLSDPDPTDVLSFVLDKSGHRLEGEVVVSAQTAAAVARRYKATPEMELLRYVIHGTLHLVGYRDRTKLQRARMRAQERRYLRSLRQRQ